MPKTILGSGWTFPVRLNRRDEISMSHFEEKIAQSIQIILGTAKGERVMRPDFGCDIHDAMFSVIDSGVLTVMRNAVEEALILWEPRIEVRDIRIDTAPLSSGRIDITVDYLVRYTNSAHNLVYPYYLESEGKLQ